MDGFVKGMQEVWRSQKQEPIQAGTRWAPSKPNNRKEHLRPIQEPLPRAACHLVCRSRYCCKMHFTNQM